MGTFRLKQVPVDFGRISNRCHWLPTNFDGVTERCGCFLIFETKHGEDLPTAQFRTLAAVAALAPFTVLIINCQWSATNGFGARDFRPASYRALLPGGRYSEEVATDVVTFAFRYNVWCRVPTEGTRVFLCDEAEFVTRYLRYLPQDTQKRWWKR